MLRRIGRFLRGIVAAKAAGGGPRSVAGAAKQPPPAPRAGIASNQTDVFVRTGDQVAALPIPPPKADSGGQVAVTPLPIPGPSGGQVAVTPLPIPAPSGDQVAVTPLPIPGPSGDQLAVTPLPIPGPPPQAGSMVGGLVPAADLEAIRRSEERGEDGGDVALDPRTGRSLNPERGGKKLDASEGDIRI